MIERNQIIDDVDESLEESIPKIYVNKRKNSKDIVDYVRARIKKSKVLRDVKKDLQEEIVKRVAEKADGMFMWAVLMMQELSQKSRSSSISQSLHHAPKGLEKMMQHVLKGFSSMLKGDDPDDLNTMLMWVTCAPRPLYLGELKVILKLRSPGGNEVLSLKEKLRKRFASFFVLTRKDRLSTKDHLSTAGLQAENLETELTNDEEGEEDLDDIEDETSSESSPENTPVAFCHASIGDFFREVTNGKVSSGPEHLAIGVDIFEAKVVVLKDCLNFICNHDYDYQKVRDCTIFNHYVSELWHTHLKDAVEILDKVGTADRQEIGTLLIKMLRGPASLLIWPAGQNYTFFTTDNLKPIKKWLECPKLYEVLALTDRQWIEKIQANEAEIFYPFARFYAFKWLRGDYFSPDECMLKIHMIISLLLVRTDRDIPGFPMKLLVQFIMEAAEWAEFEQTAWWHKRLAECLLVYRMDYKSHTRPHIPPMLKHTLFLSSLLNIPSRLDICVRLSFLFNQMSSILADDVFSMGGLSIVLLARSRHAWIDYQAENSDQAGGNLFLFCVNSDLFIITLQIQMAFLCIHPFSYLFSSCRFLHISSAVYIYTYTDCTSSPSPFPP